MTSPASDVARAGWRTAQTIGATIERIAALPIDEAEARAMLAAAAPRIDDARFPAIRAKIATCPPCVFFDWARDAAASFGECDAATMMFEPMAALIQGIRIVDDIQDEEPTCLATEVGVERALALAEAAYGVALALIARLPLHGPAWRAAAISLGRGLRETAIGQELEGEAAADFWTVVDRKTAPLAATAVEVGALAAGAPPARAAALTALAIPLGRLLQIGDDCLDALSPDAADWRAPQNNLLMRYALSGPNAPEVELLLARGADPAALHAAQIALLRDGALAYALHAHLATLGQLDQTLHRLALPHPEPFRRNAEKQRAETEALLRRCGLAA